MLINKLLTTPMISLIQTVKKTEGDIGDLDEWLPRKLSNLEGWDIFGNHYGEELSKYT